MRVLLAQTEERRLAYRLGPHSFPVRPLPFVGMASPAVRRVLEELHFDHLLKRKLRVHKPSFQIVGVPQDGSSSRSTRQTVFPVAASMASTKSSPCVSHCTYTRPSCRIGELAEPHS